MRATKLGQKIRAHPGRSTSSGQFQKAAVHLPLMDAILELEMLITAFVVTYTRLSQGGAFSGFDRSELPEKFRPFHDEIIELRNQRFAHNDGHHTIRVRNEHPVCRIRMRAS